MPFDGLRQVFPPIPALMITVFLYNVWKPLLSYPRIVITGALIGKNLIQHSDMISHNFAISCL